MILKELAKNRSGLTNFELSEKLGLTKQQVNDSLRESFGNGYVLKGENLGIEGTNYTITESGLNFIGVKLKELDVKKAVKSFNEQQKSALTQIEKTVVETVEPAQIVAKSALEQIESDPVIEKITTTEIEGFETRLKTHDEVFADVDFPPTLETLLDDDSIFSPTHYNQGSIECIEALQACMSEEEYRGFCRGNAIKYLWRLNDKATPEQNLKKARWYIDTMLENL